MRWSAGAIPRALSAAVLILGILGGMGASVYSLADDANELIESLPAAAQKLRDALRKRSGSTGHAAGHRAEGRRRAGAGGRRGQPGAPPPRAACSAW